MLIYSRYGKLYNSTNVCNLGKCVLPDHCSCPSGYSGKQCELFYCGKIEHNSAGVCSGEGSCIAPNNCTCKPGYYGDNCELYQCFGFDHSNKSACSSNGTCIGPDTCKCKDGFTGPDCGHYSCYGIDFKNSSVCTSNERGYCENPDYCICNKGYLGRQCEVAICFDQPSPAFACSGVGKCVKADKCECPYGYLGERCETLTCFGITSTNATVCSGNGRCSLPDQCVCNWGWGGPNCSIPICDDILADSPQVCSSHGKCLSPNNCSCEAGWDGKYCTTPQCFGELPYLGCYNGGRCYSPNTCTCSYRYGGERCQYYQCNGILSNESSVCSGNGVCGATGCDCNRKYYGSNCEVTMCGNYFSNSEHVCNGNGICVQPDTCQCYKSLTPELGFLGSSDCKAYCYNDGGVPYSDSRSLFSCNYQGLCGFNKTSQQVSCQCNKGYYGNRCEVRSCYGKRSDDKQVCNGKGSCEYLDMCLCHNSATNGYWDSETGCTTCLPTYTGPTCTQKYCNVATTCSGNGKCNQNQDCECFGNYGGTYCNYCKNGYFGSDCSVYCDADENCSGVGYCDTDGSCNCPSNSFKYDGKHCEKCLENYGGSHCHISFTSQPMFKSNGLVISWSMFVGGLAVDVSNCAQVFQNIAMFGKSPKCSLVFDQFSVTLGRGHSIRVGTLINVNRNAFDIWGPANTTFFIPFTVGKPVSMDYPKALVETRQPIYGYCDTILIDASKSWSPDMEDLKFYWKLIVNSSSSAIENYKYLRNEFVSGSSRLTITPNDLPPGSYNFTLKVQSTVFGLDSYTSIIFSKSSDFYPSVSIDTSSISNTIISTQVPFVIRKIFTLPTCDNSTASNSTNDYILNWEQIEGSPIQFVKDKQQNLLISSLNPNGEQSYLFKFTVQSIYNPKIYQSINVKVNSKPADLQLNMYVSEASSHKSEVIIEYEDPSLSSEKETWVFSCYGNDYIPCEGLLLDYVQNLTLNKEKEFLIDKTQLSINYGSVTLYLDIRKGTRTISSQVKLLFSNYLPPLVNIINVTPRTTKVNPQEILLLELSVTVEGSDSNDLISSRNWLLSEEAIPAELVSFMGKPLQDSNSISLDLSKLVEGQSYSLDFNVTDIDGLLTTFDYSFTINYSPKSLCSCQVDKNIGLAFDTPFVFSCPNCQSEEQSYVFSYGYYSDSLKVPIVENTGQLFETILPLPNNGTTLNCYIYVLDTLTGSSAEFPIKVDLTLQTFSNIQDVLKQFNLWLDLSNMYIITGEYLKNVYSPSNLQIAQQDIMNTMNFNNQKRSVSASSILEAINRKINVQILTSLHLETSDTLTTSSLSSIMMKLGSANLSYYSNEEIQDYFTYFSIFMNKVSESNVIQQLPTGFHTLLYSSIEKSLENNATQTIQTLLPQVNSLILKKALIPGRIALDAFTKFFQISHKSQYRNEYPGASVKLSDSKVEFSKESQTFFNTLPKRKPISYQLISTPIESFQLFNISVNSSVLASSNSIRLILNGIEDMNGNKVSYYLPINSDTRSRTFNYSCATYISNKLNLKDAETCSLTQSTNIAKCECVFNSELTVFIVKQEIQGKSVNYKPVIDPLYFLLVLLLIIPLSISCCFVLGYIGIMIRDKCRRANQKSAQNSKDVEMKPSV